MPWSEARETCQKYGGDLASILNVEEYISVLRIMKSAQHAFYIGFTDSAVEGKFIWCDGSNPSSFLNWRKGEPNDYRGEDCTVQTLTGWVDVDCRSAREFICKFFS